MKGKYKITVYNTRIRYELEIKRNITVIAGDSGSGKTTLYQMIRRSNEESSSVKLQCDVPVFALVKNWEDARRYFQDYENAIFIFDENTSYLKSEDFAREVKASSNYVVIITRAPLHMLPYSVEEIYQLDSTKGEGQSLVYTTMNNLYDTKETGSVFSPDVVLVEDSNSGFEFFTAVARNHLKVESAGGRDNIARIVSNYDAGLRVLVIADGAACGAEFGQIHYAIKSRPSQGLIWCYESFEWFLLNAGIFKEGKITEILNAPYNYIDSKDYFSWERFFTALLCEVSKQNKLIYKKDSLNRRYLEEGIRGKIVCQIPKILDL